MTDVSLETGQESTNRNIVPEVVGMLERRGKKYMQHSVKQSRVQDYPVICTAIQMNSCIRVKRKRHVGNMPLNNPNSVYKMK